MRLKGQVSIRSSRPGAGGPPGEKEILALNPQREKLILEQTGWQTLFHGSLNIECDESDLRSTLDRTCPLFLEPWQSVVYPEQYKHIPKMRDGYRYFPAILSIHGGPQHRKVLLRRAINPLQGRIEAFCDEQLNSDGCHEGSVAEIILEDWLHP
jgi:hypothetical protein